MNAKIRRKLPTNFSEEPNFSIVLSKIFRVTDYRGGVCFFWRTARGDFAFRHILSVEGLSIESDCLKASRLGDQ
uniref:Uncharacterized protein n=1 Tax=Candidatus Kentrum sp. LFY TaxID=2126342 RepID=A0A450X0P9_9GAMM|nr:MAG: hypothetical protein BECKLFY1418C_GA0070996_11301 [Candidatus Kentron sp. LFY]